MYFSGGLKMEKTMPAKTGKSKRKIHWKQYLPVYLLALPGLIYLVINNYMPMFGVVIAFKDLDFRKGILGSDWAGLNNFAYLFRTSDVWQTTRNTVCYNLVFIVLNMVLGISVAIFLNEIRNKLATRFYQSVMLVPFLISWVVVSYLVYAFLAPDTGFINNSVLKAAGNSPISWYTESKYCDGGSPQAGNAGVDFRRLPFSHRLCQRRCKRGSRQVEALVSGRICSRGGWAA